MEDVKDYINKLWTCSKELIEFTSTSQITSCGEEIETVIESGKFLRKYFTLNIDY